MRESNAPAGFVDGHAIGRDGKRVGDGLGDRPNLGSERPEAVERSVGDIEREDDHVVGGARALYRVHHHHGSFRHDVVAQQCAVRVLLVGPYGGRPCAP